MELHNKLERFLTLIGFRNFSCSFSNWKLLRRSVGPSVAIFLHLVSYFLNVKLQYFN